MPLLIKPRTVAAPTPDVLWWKFTDGSGTTVTATVGPNGTLSGGYSWVTGKSGSGYAIQCDGINGALVSASMVTYGSNVVTVCGWVWWDAYASGYDLLFESLASANPDAFAISPDDASGNAAVYLSGTAGQRWVNYARWPAATWVHLAFVFDNSTPSGLVKLYIDGSLQSNNGVPLNSKTGTSNFAAGLFKVFNRDGSTLFGAGRIDDLRIYGRELNATEVGQVYAEAF